MTDQAKITHVHYYHNDKRLLFPLTTPITGRVLHVYRVGGWKSCKWGPPPNMDGTPSSSESLDSAASPCANTAASTTQVVDSSSLTLANPAVVSTSSTPMATNPSIRPSSSLAVPKGIHHHAGVPSSSTSVTSGSAKPLSTTSTDHHSSGLICPRPSHISTPTPPTTSRLVDPDTKAAIAAHDLPTRSTQTATKTSTVPGPRTTVTLPTPARAEKTLVKPLHKSVRIGGEFEIVSEAELDEEFDVVDSEVPSAANGY